MRRLKISLYALMIATSVAVVTPVAIIAGSETNSHPIGFALSDHPSEMEIRTARMFSEPLIPTRHPSPLENQHLAAALRQYQNRIEADDFSTLEAFVQANPDSA